MIVERTKNFLRSLAGIPLPSDEAIDRLSDELKQVIAAHTSPQEQAALLIKFPAAHLESAFRGAQTRKVEPAHERLVG